MYFIHGPIRPTLSLLQDRFPFPVSSVAFWDQICFFFEKNENLSIIKLLLKMHYSRKNKTKTEKIFVNLVFDLKHKNHKIVFSKLC